MATLLGSYRAFESDTAHLDLLGGVRINDISMDIDVNVGGGFELSDGASWVDPMFGAKGRMDLNQNWYAKGTALIGGFGVSSDFVWDASVNVGYQWNNWLDLYAGFRGAGTDYRSGSFIWDVTQYGPVMGATINLNQKLNRTNQTDLVFWVWPPARKLVVEYYRFNRILVPPRFRDASRPACVPRMVS